MFYVDNIVQRTMAYVNKKIKTGNLGKSHGGEKQC